MWHTPQQLVILFSQVEMIFTIDIKINHWFNTFINFSARVEAGLNNTLFKLL